MNQHNLPSTSELLREQSAWVDRLAHSLVADPSTADDIAQDTWLAALRSPPDSARTSRPWLMRVVHNLVRRRARGSDRRAYRESVAARPEAQPSTQELVERVDLQRRLSEIVLGLPEPYRSTVVLRYFEDLTPTEIARREQIPASTARNRLARALEMLRERLDGEFADRRSWCMALVTLVRTSSMAPIAAAGPSGTVLPHASSFAIVGKLACVGIALGVLLFGMSRWSNGSASVPASILVALQEAHRPSLSVPDASHEAHRQIASSPASIEARVPVLGLQSVGNWPAAGPSSGAPTQDAQRIIHVRCRVLDMQGNPLAGVVVGQQPIPSRAGSGAGTVAPPRESPPRTDADGRCVLEFAWNLPPSVLVVLDDNCATVRAAMFNPTQQEHVLVATAARRIEGAVVDALVRPIAGATLYARVPDDLLVHVDQPVSGSSPCFAISDARGEYTLRAPDLGEARIVAVAKGYAPRELSLRELIALDGKLSLRSSEDAQPHIRGYVSDDAGAPVPDAQVSYGEAHAVTDAQGAFRIEFGWIEPGSALVADKPGFQFALDAGISRRLAEGAGVCEQVSLTLRRTMLSIRGKLLDEHDQPLTGYRILLADPTRMSKDANFGTWSYAEHCMRDSEEAFTDKDGEFVLHGLSQRDYRLIAVQLPQLINVMSDPVPAGRKGLVLHLPSGGVVDELHARVVARVGRPLANVASKIRLRKQFEVENEFIKQPFERTGSVSDAEGRFEIKAFPTRGVELVLTGDGLDEMTIGAENIRADTESTIVMGTLCRMRVELSGRGHQPDAVEARDRDNKTVLVHQEGPHSRLNLTKGKSVVVKVSDLATMLLLLRKGVEIGRLEIDLKFDQLNTVRDD
jgi:RNA polymerase sigma factor (sigma-70 family)